MPFIKKIPEGDTKLRDVCSECGFIDYKNPRLVAGALIRDEKGRMLLHQTAVGWSLPYGYVQAGETTQSAAARIAWEKTGFVSKTDRILALDEMVADRQVILTFEGYAQSKDVSSATARFFEPHEIPALVNHDPAALNILHKNVELQTRERFAPSVLQRDFSRARQSLIEETTRMNAAGHACSVKLKEPKMVAGLVAEYDGKVALGLRPSPPGWVIFSGYVEGGETLQAAAVRETFEEAFNREDYYDIAEARDLIAVYEIPHRGEVLTIFRGSLKSPELSHNAELADARLFNWGELPENFAFPMVPHVLNKHRRNKDRSLVVPCHMLLPPFTPGAPPPPLQSISTYQNG